MNDLTAIRTLLHDAQNVEVHFGERYGLLVGLLMREVVAVLKMVERVVGEEVEGVE